MHSASDQKEMEIGKSDFISSLLLLYSRMFPSVETSRLHKKSIPYSYKKDACGQANLVHKNIIKHN